MSCKSKLEKEWNSIENRNQSITIQEFQRIEAEEFNQFQSMNVNLQYKKLKQFKNVEEASTMIQNYYRQLHERIGNEEDGNCILDQNICFQIYQTKLAKKRIVQFSQTVNQLIKIKDNEKKEESFEVLQSWGSKIEE